MVFNNSNDTQENNNNSLITTGGAYQNEEEADLQQQIQVYRKQHHSEGDDNDVEANGGRGEHAEGTIESSPVQNLNCTFASVVVFVILGAIWGSAFSFIKLSVDPKFGFSAFSVVFMRLMIGGIFMLVLFIFNFVKSKEFRSQVNKHRGIKTILMMMVLGFFNNAVPFILVAFAEQSINSGIASILDSSIPLFSIFIGHFTLKGERITFLKLVGLIVGFAGVILVCLEQVIVGETPDEGQIIGYVTVTLAAASYGVASVIAKKYLDGVPSLFTACGQIFSAALFSLLGVLIYDLGIDSRHLSYFKHANYLAWISVVYLGVFSTGVAYVCYFYLIKKVGSTKQSLVGYALPIFGVAEGAIFLGEWENIPFYIPIIEILGMVLIFAGIAVVSIPSWRKIRESAQVISKSSKRDKDMSDAILDQTVEESSSLLNGENPPHYYDQTKSIQ